MSKEWVTVNSREFFDVGMDGVTVRDVWPGFPNVRVQVLKEVKPPRPEIFVGDGVLCRGLTTSGYCVDCLGVAIRGQFDCVTVAQTDGKIYDMTPESVVQIYRDRKIIYNQPQQTSGERTTAHASYPAPPE